MNAISWDPKNGGFLIYLVLTSITEIDMSPTKKLSSRIYIKVKHHLLSNQDYSIIRVVFKMCSLYLIAWSFKCTHFQVNATTPHKSTCNNIQISTNIILKLFPFNSPNDIQYFLWWKQHHWLHLHNFLCYNTIVPDI